MDALFQHQNATKHVVSAGPARDITALADHLAEFIGVEWEWFGGERRGREGMRGKRRRRKKYKGK